MTPDVIIHPHTHVGNQENPSNVTRPSSRLQGVGSGAETTTVDQATCWAHELASFPGLPRERGKAWYTLFTHARILKNDASQKIVGVYVNSVSFALHSGPSGYNNRLRVSSD